jgi:polysaccharide biosynthesis protein PelG
MAGIGFELRKLLNRQSLSGLLQAYTYAGIIGSGPWVLSIVGMLAIGLLSAAAGRTSFEVTQFQTSVTYLIAVSLVFTGPVQLAFTRFISDRLFEKRDDWVMPNFNGVLLLVMGAAIAFALPLLLLFFSGQSVAYRVLMMAGFTLLSGIWVATIFLSGLKRYKTIVALYFVGYATVVVVALSMRSLGLEGLLFGFVVGHFLLFTGMWAVTAYHYRPERPIAFDFLRRDLVYPSLMGIGLLYNLAVWADKFMFWAFPYTHSQVIGPLYASVIYDLPVFLAYLSIIPGMAVFLVRIETDFAEYYERFYDAVRSGGSLEYIEGMRDEMVHSIRLGLAEIGKIQTLAVLVTFVAGPSILSALGISLLYVPLLHVQVVGAGLQVILLALLNVFFYLDLRRWILVLCVEFLALNVVLTGATLWLGAPFYGYGFVVSVLITLGTGLALLDHKLSRLEYETFMLQ